MYLLQGSSTDCGLYVCCDMQYGPVSTTKYFFKSLHVLHFECLTYSNCCYKSLNMETLIYVYHNLYISDQKMADRRWFKAFF